MIPTEQTAGPVEYPAHKAAPKQYQAVVVVLNLGATPSLGPGSATTASHRAAWAVWVIEVVLSAVGEVQEPASNVGTIGPNGAARINAVLNSPGMKILHITQQVEIAWLY
jgi:hypothetical protein